MKFISFGLASAACVALLTLAAITPAKADEFKPTCTDTSRTCLVTAARAYINGLLTHDDSKVPFGSSVRFTELAKGGAMSSEAKMHETIKHQVPLVGIGNVRYFADEKKHQVVVLALLRANWDKETAARFHGTEGPFTVHLMERFRVEQGRITEIENFFFNEGGTSDGISNWPDEPE